MSDPETSPHPDLVEARRIVLFDGFCGLCDGLVSWLVEQDTRGRLRFAPLQGVTARRWIGEAEALEPETVVYVEEGTVYTRSEAVLRMLTQLGGVWKGFSALLLVPRFVRDGVYGIVAGNRFRWFERRSTCKVPTPDEAARFLP